ncbi:unnamed protein product [Protopolystoma xenopodis]|uniref:Uncharacterized protein n=1 Tax=Protopolystoma xenopodis TaxID=117903 RepID=A0A448XKA8_9PLAT|nr:unnamed protein product [Protopolystoma xenopodis]
MYINEDEIKQKQYTTNNSSQGTFRSHNERLVPESGNRCEGFQKDTKSDVEFGQLAHKLQAKLKLFNGVNRISTSGRPRKPSPMQLLSFGIAWPQPDFAARLMQMSLERQMAVRENFGLRDFYAPTRSEIIRHELCRLQLDSSCYEESESPNDLKLSNRLPEQLIDSAAKNVTSLAWMTPETKNRIRKICMDGHNAQMQYIDSVSIEEEVADGLRCLVQEDSKKG